MNDTTHSPAGDDLEARLARALTEREDAVEAALDDVDAREDDAAFVETLRSEWLEPAPALRPVGRRRTVPRWLPVATAAAVLVGVVTLSTNLGGDAGPESRIDGSYLDVPQGDQAAAGAFDGTVEWPVSFDVPPFYDVVIRDLDPAKFGDDAVVATYKAQEGPAWTCPDDLETQLPERFAVELHDIAAAPGQQPQRLEFSRR
ncbi:MAG: hypothetical protein AAF726_04175 [Planctomycetota bacterium]